MFVIVRITLFKIMLQIYTVKQKLRQNIYFISLFIWLSIKFTFSYKQWDAFKMPTALYFSYQNKFRFEVLHSHTGWWITLHFLEFSTEIWIIVCKSTESIFNILLHIRDIKVICKSFPNYYSYPKYQISSPNLRFQFLHYFGQYLINYCHGKKNLQYGQFNKSCNFISSVK